MDETQVQADALEVPAPSLAAAISQAVPAPSEAEKVELALEHATLARQAKSGGDWFFWVAGLSIINSIISLANGQWSFLAGLGITQVIDVVASSAGGGSGFAPTIALILDLLAAAIFVMFGILTRHRQSWSYLIGMVLYALDGLIFLVAGEWLGAAFHVFVLYSLYRGLVANRALLKMTSSQSLAG